MPTDPISKAEIKRRVAAAANHIERLRTRHALEMQAAENRLAEAQALVPVAAPRIDKLEPGQRVRLLFTGSFNGRPYEENAIFLGISGEGDDREATFQQDHDGQPFKWDAYRYDGGWAYGSSAERLRLLEVLAD